MERFSYLLFYLFALFIMVLPKFFRDRLFRTLAHFAYALDSRHRRIIRANLDLVFKEKMTVEEKTAIAKICFENLLSEIVSVIEIYFSPKSSYRKMIEVKGREHFEKAQRSGQGVVFFINHYNNLEIAGIGLAMVTPAMQVVQKSHNRYINNFITKSREKNGLKIIFMDKALRHLAGQLKRGGAISIAVDQSVNQDAGILVDLFGQPTMHLNSASFLARKFDAALIPLSLDLKPGGGYLFTIHEAVPFAKSDDEEKDIRYLTQFQAHFLEQQINEDPRPWFWCHRRWKTTLPEIYSR